LLAKGPSSGYRFEIAIAMQSENVVIDGDLRDAAVDRTANSLPNPSKIEVDSRGVNPRLGTAFQIVLRVQILSQETPCLLITRSLQQFELVKPREDDLLSIERPLEGLPLATAAIAENFDPHRCIDQNQPRSFRIDL
jgi:hypothetical protein